MVAFFVPQKEVRPKKEKVENSKKDVEKGEIEDQGKDNTTENHRNGIEKSIPPKAIIEGPDKAFVGEKVQFSGEKSSDEDGEIVAFRWSFGDGTDAEEAVTTHVYHEPGNYRVSLVVVDNDGLKDTDILQIEIEEKTPDPPKDKTDDYSSSATRLRSNSIDLSGLTFEIHKTNGGVLPLDKIALEDLNRDGKLDLIVTTSRGSQVMIFRGQGDGQFCSGVNLSSGGNSESVSVGDINGDGFFDLIFSHLEKRSLTILVGRDTRSFEDLVSIGLEDPPSGLAMGDFNKDGFNDLAVSSKSSDTVRIFWGGKEILNKDTYNLSVKTPSSLISGDFDGDGNLDLAIESRGKLLLAKGQASTTFESPEEVLSLPFANGEIVQGDFNRDGIADIVAFKKNEGVIHIFIGTSKGVFEKTFEYDTKLELMGIVLGDINGDEIPDIIVTTKDSNKTTVLLSKVSQ